MPHNAPCGPATLTYPSRPVTDILETVAPLRPAAVATRFLGHKLTYGELAARARQFARRLDHLGLQPGDRVGLMLPNCPQFILAAFGVLLAGGVIVNINPAFTPRELDLVLGDAAPRVLITLDTLLPTVKASARGGGVEHLITTPLEAGPLAWTALTATTDDAPFEPRATADDVAVLQYTGGTTGTPKAAMLSHRNLFANVVQSTVFMYGEPERFTDRYLLVIPMFHIYGFTIGMLRALWVGATITLLPKFDPAMMLREIRQQQPGYVPGVPTLYVALLGHPDLADARMGEVRAFHTGGAPCPIDLIERFEAATGRPLHEGYGMSEASPVICSTPQTGPRKPGTVGVPLPGTDLKIVDLDTGEQVLPPGEAGELCVSGPQVMQGYWQQPEETARTVRTDASGRRWLYTGDIARLDEDGYVTLVQRKKDVIIVDAFNVYPSEVEEVLHAHPDVRMAAAFGVPDAYHGEVVRASVVLSPGAQTTVTDLVAHCRRHLAPYKVPAGIDVRETLPMSAVGKVLYRVLRSEAAAPKAE